MREIIVDNFAGGGGASTGIEMATGRSVDIAINHDQNAIDMHMTNHPDTLHYCENVFDVNPVVACGGRRPALVWFSPDCRHFSKAKGAMPVKKEIRGLAWVSIRWALDTRFRVGVLENVKEFRTWGPLLTMADGTHRPDPARAGETFAAFVAMLTTGIAADHPALDECCEVLGIASDSDDRLRLIAGLGYNVEFRELRASKLGTPTIRERFFMVMRCDGRPIAWPKQTHGDRKSPEVRSGKLKPFRTAAEIIDWNIPSKSIFERKKSLADNTLRRVAKGLWRHVLTNAEPFIVGVGGRMGQSPERSVLEPMQTVTSKADSCLAQPVFAPFTAGAGGPEYSGKPAAVDQPFGTLTTENHRAVVGPVLAPFLNEHANASNQRTMPVDEPMRTLCAQVKGGHFSVVAPSLVSLHGTSDAHLVGHDIDQPLSTITAGGGHHALVGAELVTAHIQRDMGNSVGHGADEPLATITAGGGGKAALVGAHLITIGYGEREGQQARAQDINAPLGTVVAANKHALVAAHLAHLTHHGDRPGTTPADPLPTVTAAHRGEQALICANLVDMGHGEQCGTGAKRWSDGARSLDTPLNTVTASSVPSALTSAFFEQANGGFYDGDGHAADAPMSTITSAGSNQRLVTAYVVKYYSCGGQSQGVDEPVHTLTAKARMGLVQVIKVPIDCLSQEHREKARQCAQLLHKYLPEHFPEPADMVLMSYRGIWWALVDITLRMLQPPELYGANGFPSWYVIDMDYKGKKYSKEQQVARCGNAVPPQFAEALVRANLPELCVVREEVAA
ncbi:DNA cytosine methyltransferase [Sodalis ligni]|uniref:DNA (Cytosine-5)-methyltransferase 1 n=1 Tax=Sodalis ligni TaxID=2697027 RepID=A0A4R1NGP7_9GAMM|nr:DNA cytosine methyltransferase [Sodalis ligni]TCL06875.1 DNA (cytosine-5)-methyltransferase 1 [Sodalis ligni]